MTISRQYLRATLAGATALSATKVEAIVETAFDLPGAMNTGNTGSHGAEKSGEAAGTFSACACAIVKPSATISVKPNAKVAHLRTMDRAYTRVRRRAIRNVNLPVPP
jgi:hypothetical protein